MKTIAFLFILIGSVVFCQTGMNWRDAKIRSCKTFAECVTRADGTDLHRRKVQFYDAAIALWKSSDTQEARARVLYLRAVSLIREAKGDTGFKGDSSTILKVTHTDEYKDKAFADAKEDLDTALSVGKGLEGAQKRDAEKLLKEID